MSDFWLTNSWKFIYPCLRVTIRHKREYFSGLNSGGDDSIKPVFSAVDCHIILADMEPNHIQSDVQSDNIPDLCETPCPKIYANSGTWVDKAKDGCTYVETEEASGDRLWVWAKEYPSKDDLYDFQGFVEIETL
jgi:hypothetical protein